MGLLEIEEELEQLEEIEAERKEISKLTTEELRNELLLYKTAVSSFLERGPENICWTGLISELSKLLKVSAVFPTVKRTRRVCKVVTCTFKNKWETKAMPYHSDAYIFKVYQLCANSVSSAAELLGLPDQQVKDRVVAHLKKIGPQEDLTFDSECFDFTDSLKKELENYFVLVQEYKTYTHTVEFGPLKVLLALQGRKFMGTEPCIIIQDVVIPVEERGKGYFTAFLKTFLNTVKYTPFKAVFFDVQATKRFRSFLIRHGFRLYHDKYEHCETRINSALFHILNQVDNELPPRLNTMKKDVSAIEVCVYLEEKPNEPKVESKTDRLECERESVAA